MTVKLPPCYDVSHYRPVNDWTKVVPYPYLVITKATEGLTYVDETFVPHFIGLQQNNIFRGAYHFHRKAYDPTKQAAHFCNTVAPYITQKDILILDVEEGGETAAQLMTFCQYVMGKFPTNLFMIYSRKNILDKIPMFMRPLVDNLTQHPLNAISMTAEQAAFFRTIKIWTAGYPSNPDLYNTIPSYYIPDQTKYGEAWLWQYTSTQPVTGIYSAVDCNLVSQKLIEWLGSQLPPPPPTGGTMETWKVITASLKVRSGPGTTYTQTEGLNLGDQVEGVFDAASGWIHISKIIRVNGTQKAFDGWCSGGALYVEKVIVTPPPPAKTLTEIIIAPTKGTTITRKYNDGTQEVETV